MCRVKEAGLRGSADKKASDRAKQRSRLCEELTRDTPMCQCWPSR